MRGIVIEPNGSSRFVNVITLADMQDEVGGDIQLLSIPSRRLTMYCNELGKWLGFEANDKATALCEILNVGLAPGDYIAGAVLVLGEVDELGNDTDIPEPFAHDLMLA